MNNDSLHGTIKQHLRYLRLREKALSLLEAPTPPPAKPVVAVLDTGALVEVVKPQRKPHPPIEFKIVALRECPLPESMHTCTDPEQAVAYWRGFIETNPYFNPENECFVVIMLNTRHKIKGHHVVSHGTKDTLLVSPGECFRAAVIANAAAVVLMHNHPSGESTPSDADIKVTRDMIRAGQLLKIEVLDHVVIGRGQRSSLRELGYFYT
jgi:DNA repair protein RadC